MRFPSAFSVESYWSSELGTSRHHTHFPRIASKGSMRYCTVIRAVICGWIVHFSGRVPAVANVCVTVAEGE